MNMTQCSTLGAVTSCQLPAAPTASFVPLVLCVVGRSFQYNERRRGRYSLRRLFTHRQTFFIIYISFIQDKTVFFLQVSWWCISFAIYYLYFKAPRSISHNTVEIFVTAFQVSFQVRNPHNIIEEPCFSRRS